MEYKTKISEEEIEEPSEDEEEFDFDEVEDFDELGESYLKKVYENINSFKTTKCTEKGNKGEAGGACQGKRLDGSFQRQRTDQA